MTPIALIPNNPLGGFALPTTAALSSASLEALVPEGEIFPPGDT